VLVGYQLLSNEVGVLIDWAYATEAGSLSWLPRATKRFGATIAATGFDLTVVRAISGPNMRKPPAIRPLSKSCPAITR